MKILLFSKYSYMGASSRLRSLQYIDALKEHNIDVTVHSLFNDEYLISLYQHNHKNKLNIIKLYFERLKYLFKVNKFDIIWIEKELFPYCPAIAERILSFLKVKYIVDYDDAIFHNYDQSNNFFIKHCLSKKIDVVMNRSNYVVAGNEYLANKAIQSMGSRVKIIPTVVDLSRYSLKVKEGTELVIGWIGSPSTEKYLLTIKEALILVCKECNASLLLIGATSEILSHFSEIDVTLVEWSEKIEVSSIQKMSVGIMPLVDQLWEKGKCGYKLIQYMACGIPVVASPVGVNVDIVRENKCGYLAKTTEEWTYALKELLHQSDLRLELGLQGRSAVEEKYSTKSQSLALIDIFNRVYDNDKTSL